MIYLYHTKLHCVTREYTVRLHKWQVIQVKGKHLKKKEKFSLCALTIMLKDIFCRCKNTHKCQPVGWALVISLHWYQELEPLLQDYVTVFKKGKDTNSLPVPLNSCNKDWTRLPDTSTPTYCQATARLCRRTQHSEWASTSVGILWFKCFRRPPWSSFQGKAEVTVPSSAHRRSSPRAQSSVTPLFTTLKVVSLAPHHTHTATPLQSNSPTIADLMHKWRHTAIPAEQHFLTHRCSSDFHHSLWRDLSDPPCRDCAILTEWQQRNKD